MKQGGVYKRGNLWWIFYQQDGKKKLESSGSRIRLDAVNLLKSRLSSPVQKEVLVKDILDGLMQDYDERGKKGVYKSRSHLKHVYRLLGNRRVVDLDETAIENYQRLRSKTHSHATINRECQMLGQALNRIALRKGIISKPIYIRKLEEFNIRRDFFEPCEVERLIAALPDYLQDLTRFAHISAWRKSEITTLVWDDVSPTAIRLSPTRNKTGDSRVLPLDAELKALLARRAQQKVEGCPYVFHRKGHVILDFRKAWNKALAQTGYKGRVFHALRRSAVRDDVRAGTPEDIVMKKSGHKTRAMLTRYNITAEQDILLSLQRTATYRQLQSQLQSQDGA